MDAGNKNFAPPRRSALKFHPPGPRRREENALATNGIDAAKIGEVQARIDEIKLNMKEKTLVMGIWGTLADLYALKSSFPSGVEDGGGTRDVERRDAIDKSMEEYIAGYREYQAGNLVEAEIHLVASIERLDWNVLARMTLGNMFFVAGDHENAKVAFMAAIPHCEGVALSELLTNLGMNALKAGQIQDAETHFTRAIEIDPANAYALNNLGLVSEAKDDVEGAISCFKKAVGIDSSDEEFWYNLGNVLGKAGRKAERLFCFMRAEERGFTELKDLVNDLVAQGIKPSDPRESRVAPSGS
ncbi:MAG: tetratricopeptide repeat protein [Candidatus Lokiarchaeota archaeon]|nr:tetratricopeptide repeat protein [Candidatus Lokiarchaeota archaeon]